LRAQCGPNKRRHHPAADIRAQEGRLGCIDFCDGRGLDGARGDPGAGAVPTSVAESSELSDAGALDTACTVPADNPLYQTAKGFCAGYMIRGDNVMEGAYRRHGLRRC
jgi:hypothetical protein